jgi:hypothetical protein
MRVNVQDVQNQTSDGKVSLGGLTELTRGDPLNNTLRTRFRVTKYFVMMKPILTPNTNLNGQKSVLCSRPMSGNPNGKATIGTR